MENENSPRGKRNPSFQADEFDLKDLPGIQFSLSKKALSYPLVDSNYTKAVHYHPFRVDFSKVFHLTHISKFSGHDSGDFSETFSKKFVLQYCDVTTDDN